MSENLISFVINQLDVKRDFLVNVITTVTMFHGGQDQLVNPYPMHMLGETSVPR
jgi:hypothetical protein